MIVRRRKGLKSKGRSRKSSRPSAGGTKKTRARGRR